MPQASLELASKWPGGDTQAVNHLQSRGFVLKAATWSWSPPKDRNVTTRDVEAIAYLMHEWDFGGLDDAEEPGQVRKVGEA